MMISFLKVIASYILRWKRKKSHMNIGLGRADIAGHTGVNHYLKCWSLCHRRFININIMNKKRLLIQVLAAVLFVCYYFINIGKRIFQRNSITWNFGGSGLWSPIWSFYLAQGKMEAAGIIPKSIFIEVSRQNNDCFSHSILPIIWQTTALYPWKP